MLVGGGPWLGVLGGVFTDKVIVQRLTDLMWCAHSTTEEDSRGESTVWHEFWWPFVDVSISLKFFTRTSATPRTRH